MWFPGGWRFRNQASSPPPYRLVAIKCLIFFSLSLTVQKGLQYGPNESKSDEKMFISRFLIYWRKQKVYNEFNSKQNFLKFTMSSRVLTRWVRTRLGAKQVAFDSTLDENTEVVFYACGLKAFFFPTSLPPTTLFCPPSAVQVINSTWDFWAHF